MAEGAEKSPVVGAASGELASGWGDGRAVRGDNSGFAQRADGCVGVESQDALLAGIEARLTQEVLGLVASLREFSSRAQLIRKEIPEGAHFCKAVTSLLSLIALQYAESLGKSLDRPLLLDDGAEYLRKFGLRLEDSIREVTLDGRRFMAVAFLDESGDKGEGGREAADK